MRTGEIGNTDEDTAIGMDGDYRRLPGLYRAWDLQFVLQDGADARVDHAGRTEDGTPLFAVYTRAGDALVTGWPR